MAASATYQLLSEISSFCDKYCDKIVPFLKILLYYSSSSFSFN